MDVEFRLREINLSDKPDDFLELSPTGKVPMIVDDDLVLYESQVINDYLVDKYEWDGAYPGDLKQEYRQKVCMKQWDSTILGPFYEGLGDPGILEQARDDILSELEYLNDVVDRLDGHTDNVFAFHFAPFWGRMTWLEEYTEFPRWVRRFDPLAGWMDRTLEEEPVSSTLPEREPTVQTYEKHYVKTA